MAGEYKCTATNSQGSEEATARLTFMCKFKVFFSSICCIYIDEKVEQEKGQVMEKGGRILNIMNTFFQLTEVHKYTWCRPSMDFVRFVF